MISAKLLSSAGFELAGRTQRPVCAVGDEDADAPRSDHLTRQYYGQPLLLLEAATAVRQGC